MDTTNGDYELMTALALHDMRAAGGPPPGKVIVEGTADELEQLSRRVSLGARQLDTRKARRTQQKASRRRNR